MKIIDQKSFVAGLFYLGLGGGTALMSLALRLGTAGRMGPGFFPLLVGSLLALTGLVVLFGSLQLSATPTRIGALSIRRTLIVVTAVALFAVSIEPLGMLVAIPLLVCFASLANEPYNWRSVLLSIAVLIPLVWVIFILILSVPFPLLPKFL